MMNKEMFSKRFKTLIASHGFNNKDVAEILDCKIAQISHWAVGYVLPPPKHLLRIIVRFQLKPDFFVTENKKGFLIATGDTINATADIVSARRLSQRLRVLFAEKGLRHKVLVDELGVSIGTMSAWMTGRCYVNFSALIHFILKFELDYTFFDGKERSEL